jgi:DNA-binding transcriptional LysR family regulator
LTLTQEGHRLLDSCRRIFTEVEAISQEFDQAKASPKGRLRVSLPSCLLAALPGICQFMNEYPEIELDMDFADHAIDVVDGGYDIVVSMDDASDSRLMSRRLATYRMAIVGSADYFTRMRRPSAPEDLAEHACLHHRSYRTGKLQPWPLLRPEAGIDPDLPIAAASTTMESLISLAELGIGLVCVPDFAVRRQIEDGTFVRVLEDHIEQEGSLRAVWPSSKYLAPKLRAFLDFLVKYRVENMVREPNPATSAHTAFSKQSKLADKLNRAA